MVNDHIDVLCSRFRAVVVINIMTCETLFDREGLSTLASLAPPHNCSVMPIALLFLSRILKLAQVHLLLAQCARDLSSPSSCPSSSSVAAATAWSTCVQHSIAAISLWPASSSTLSASSPAADAARAQ